MEAELSDDEAGLLPKDLKHGVLSSEVGIWNVLSSLELSVNNFSFNNFTFLSFNHP